MGMTRKHSMCATEVLLFSAPFHSKGYNYNGNFAYLPGNGGTLLTVAMMAAGTETSPAMAFPAAWGAVAEGFQFPYP